MAKALLRSARPSGHKAGPQLSVTSEGPNALDRQLIQARGLFEANEEKVRKVLTKNPSFWLYDSEE
jgi:hypothetical protein